MGPESFENKRTEVLKNCPFSESCFFGNDQDCKKEREDLIKRINEVTIPGWENLIIPTLFITGYSARLLNFENDPDKSASLIEKLLLLGFEVGDIEDLATLGGDIANFFSREKFFNDDQEGNRSFTISVLSVGLILRKSFNRIHPDFTNKKNEPVKVPQSITDFLDTLNFEGI